MSRRLSRVLGIALITLAVVSTSWAYFTTTGAGSASGSIITLGTPTISSATPGGGTVTLSWSAVTTPDSSAVSYYVTRDGGTPAGTCPTSASPAGVTSCIDSGVSIGTHQYTVTAVWRSWTTTSAFASARVTFGAATHLLLAASSTTPSPGASDNLTITAQDAANNTVLTYSGSHSLTFTGAGTIGTNHPTVTSSTGATINFGSATAITFTNGVATVSGTSNGVMKLYKAETAAITVSDGSISNSAGLSVTVSPLAAASLSLSAASTTPTAGADDNLTLTALDTYGNTATSYTGSHNLTFAGASTIGTNHPTVTSSVGTATNFGTATPITFTSGLATVSGSSNGVMKLYKAETASVTVTDGSISNGTGSSLTVAAAAPATISLSAASTTPVAGAADNLTLTLQDTYGNGISGSQSLTFGGASTIGAFSPTVSSSTGAATSFGTATAITFSNGTATVSGSSNGVMKLYKAETAHITVSDGAVNNGTGLAITVSPASAASLTLSAASLTPTAGASDNLTITALDAYGNTATAYTGSHNLTFAGASTIGTNHPTVTSSLGIATNFGTPTAINFVNGVSSVLLAANGVMTLYKAESTAITVSDGSISNGAGLSLTVSAAAAQPSGLAYVDNNTTTADQITGTTTANLTVTATETAGDHVGNTYTATSNLLTGAFTINVEAYNGSGGVGNQKSFTYSVVATDAYGNQTAPTTVSATDTK